MLRLLHSARANDAQDRHCASAAPPWPSAPQPHRLLPHPGEMEQGGDLRVIHPDPYAVAGNPGLGDLENRGADPIAVADADLVIAESFDSEVLAELSVHEVLASELAFPVPIGLDLVDEHGALLPSVPREVALTIALDIELAGAAGTGDGVLEHAREYRLPPPLHVLRHADVDRQQRADRLGGRLGRFWLPRFSVHAYQAVGTGSSTFSRS